MRVNNHVLDAYGQRNVDRASGAKPEAAKQAEESAKSGSSEAAMLSISGEAKRLAASQAAVDTEKVAAIKSRIDSGDFQIDAQAIARRVLDKLA